MKVSIYKLPDNRIDLMVEAAPGNGKAPVVLQRIVKDGLADQLMPVLLAQKGRRLEPSIDL